MVQRLRSSNREVYQLCHLSRLSLRDPNTRAVLPTQCTRTRIFRQRIRHIKAAMSHLPRDISCTARICMDFQDLERCDHAFCIRQVNDLAGEIPLASAFTNGPDVLVNVVYLRRMWRIMYSSKATCGGHNIESQKFNKFQELASWKICCERYIDSRSSYKRSVFFHLNFLLARSAGLTSN